MIIKIHKSILRHSLFWGVYFTLNTLRWGSYFDDYLYSFQSNLVEFFVHIVLVYFNLYFLLPRLIPNKYLEYISILLISILTMTLVRIMFTYEFVTTNVFPESQQSKGSIFDLNYIVAAFIGEIYVIGFTTAIKITIDYVKNLRKTEELEKQGLKNELSLLKSQLQPHFFFNTLNNLYSLTLEKSDQAPETVVKLSEFMSYVIYQGNKKKVSLTNEIKYIQNYIDLECLRYGDRVNVEFSISGTILGHTIPPLLLLQFIENAFKHGTDHELGAVTISIEIVVKDSWLHFKTKNRKKNTYSDKVKHEGIGLKNTRRRLSLLFENQYDLILNDTTTNYTVDLKIPLVS